MAVVLAFVEGDEHLGFVLGVVVEGVAEGFALGVVLPALLLHLLLRAVVDDGLVDAAVGVEDVLLAFVDFVEGVVVGALLDAAEFVVLEAEAAFYLALSVFDVHLDELVVGIVDVVGAADDAVLIVDDMFEGGESEAVVLVAGAEDNVLGDREVGLTAALAFLVVFGDEVLHLVAAGEVVVEVVVGLIHGGVDALDGAAEAVVLQVVAALCAGGERDECDGHAGQEGLYLHRWTVFPFIIWYA